MLLGKQAQPIPQVKPLLQVLSEPHVSDPVSLSSCSLPWGVKVLFSGPAAGSPLPGELIAMSLESLESGVPLSCVLLGSLHWSALLSCAGVNEFVLIQLFEDEKCHGRALLLLPRMKRSVPDPTVLCLATGCHSCSTHNAERKSAYPAMGSSSFQSLSLVCALLVC